ncbi:Serine--tRNA ligase [subsurface metagenome]
MINLKLLRENPEIIRQAVKNRSENLDLDEIIELDKLRRTGITKIQNLKKERNEISEKVGKLKQQGKNPQELMEKARDLSNTIKDSEKKQREIEDRFTKAVQWIPNIPHESVPIGKGSEENQFIRGLKEPPKSPSGS